MFAQLANKKTIDPNKIVKILKDGEDYLIHNRKIPPYELLASEYKWLLFTYKFLVEVAEGVAINTHNIVSYDMDSVLLEDGSEIQLTEEKVKKLQFTCLQLDCGKEDHISHSKVMNLAERITKLEAAKIQQDNDPDALPSNKIDENTYSKI